MPTPVNPLIAAPRAGLPPDKSERARVREILKALAHAVSGLKLYPAQHETVRRLRDDLFDRLEAFLREDRPLELGIRENAFTYGGEEVFRDDNIQKSLPFFFFKDGMQKLSFLPGLTRTDLQDFLSLIRDAFQQTAGAGDIVDGLWQNEIEHIRFFAPNEFLTAKVAAGTTMPLDVSLDPRVLTEGKIGLAPDDRADLLSLIRAAAVRQSNAPCADPEAAPPADESEARALTALLESERRISIERDFLDTIYELLYLEDRPGPFRETLEYLARFNEHLIQTAHFSGALLLWDEMSKLSGDLGPSQPAKAASLDDLIERFKRQGTPDALRAVARQGLLWDFEPFFAYLERLGPSILAFVGELYESGEDRKFRTQAEVFFVRAGQRDPALLAALADPDKPDLARTILSALAAQTDRRVLPHLLAFAAHPDPSIRRAVIQALRAFPGPESRRALAGFLEDADEDLRIEAALGLRADASPDAAPAILRAAAAGDFRNRSLEETAVFLDALGATGTDEALAFLRDLVAKRRWKRNERRLALSLAAVRGLERMGTPEAEEVLRAGARRRNRPLRAACRAALARGMGGRRPDGDTV